MRRACLIALLALLSSPIVSRTAWAQSDQQEVVDRATLAVQDVVGSPPNNDVLSILRRARAVMVCPQLFKAGFFLGGEGGSGVYQTRRGMEKAAFYATIVLSIVFVALALFQLAKS